MMFEQRMKELGIDVAFSKRVLEILNHGKGSAPLVQVSGIPSVDGNTIIPMEGAWTWSCPLSEARSNLERLMPGLDVLQFGNHTGDRISFTRRGLEALGELILPLVSYGVLNGGSATSYADEKRNRAFSPELFSLLEAEFHNAAEQVRGKPKGITPAYLNPDGSSGYSFLELKFRALLLKARDWLVRHPQVQAGRDLLPLFPVFQMTSDGTDLACTEAFAQWRESGALAPLMAKTGIDPLSPLTGVQPLVATFSHSSHGQPRAFFDQAYGKPGEPLGVPGGHGQNFHVLGDVYRRLLAMGKRFVMLGNVDNLGFLPDSPSIAIMALSGAQGGFDFAWRTAVDVKGGVLVRDSAGKLNCADIGVGISFDQLTKVEQEGGHILFNAASGIFNLEWLVGNLDTIIDSLPLRVSDQDKDAGRYSQAEQVTWEIISLMDKPVIFGVDKYRRFLAAKLLLENLMTSGLRLNDPGYPHSEDQSHNLHLLSRQLNGGLNDLLSGPYGLKLSGGRWSPAELRNL